MRTLLSLLLACVSIAFVHAAEFTVAAGAGFRRPITELAVAYEKATGDKVTQVYGHLGQVIAQARESGTISMVCGDRVVLEAAPGLSFASYPRLGLGKLVVAYRKGATLNDARGLASPDFVRIGIPDQVNAMYGKAGRQFLDRSGLASKIDSKLLPVATVPQVTSYVVSGEVDAGFVNATDAIGVQRSIGGYVEVDPGLYDPIEIACGVVSGAPQTDAAQRFGDWLARDEARSILKRHGL